MPDRMSEQELNKLINMLELSQDDSEMEFDISFMVSEDPENDNGGRVLVRAGKIFVQDPLPGGSPAVVMGVLPVILYVNGEPINGPAEVTTGDIIEWEIAEPPLYSITVSEDHLLAFLRFTRPKDSHGS